MGARPVADGHDHEGKDRTVLKEIKVTVSGNVTREPELKHRKIDGRPFTVVAIAVNDRHFDRQNQQWVEDGVTYYDIICKGALGANVLASVSTGMPVVAHGRFRMHEWTTETMRGARPGIAAESLGVDLAWGTTTYTRGTRSYPAVDDGYGPTPPPASEGGPADVPPGDDPEDEDLDAYADADGVLTEEGARALGAEVGEAA